METFITVLGNLIFYPLFIYSGYKMLVFLSILPLSWIIDLTGKVKKAHKQSLKTPDD
jgi:hypothetical protein